MLSDKKIKKQLDNELKPTISADQFCAEAGITFEAQDTHKQKRSTKWAAKVFLPLASAAVISLCIALPITLRREPEDISQIKYGENDTVYKTIEIDTLFADEHIVMFNRSYMQQEGTTYLISPIDSDMTLGYKISNIIYAEIVNETPSFAFSIDYLVRCYDGYMVHSTDIYSNLDYVCTYSGIDFNYSVIGNNRSKSAYITFAYEEYDYYIQLNSYGQFTQINEDSVQLFLQKAFSEEKQSDEAVNGRQVDT